MNILSRFLVLLTLLVVSWGWLENPNFSATDLKSFFSPSSSVLVASAPTNPIPKEHPATEDTQKLDLNKTVQEVQINPRRDLPQVSSNNAPAPNIEEVINTLEIERWAEWDRWGGWNGWFGWVQGHRWGGWNGWFGWAQGHGWNGWNGWNPWAQWEILGDLPTLLQVCLPLSSPNLLS